MFLIEEKETISRKKTEKKVTWKIRLREWISEILLTIFPDRAKQKYQTWRSGTTYSPSLQPTQRSQKPVKRRFISFNNLTINGLISPKILIGNLSGDLAIAMRTGCFRTLMVHFENCKRIPQQGHFVFFSCFFLFLFFDRWDKILACLKTCLWIPETYKHQILRLSNPVHSSSSYRHLRFMQVNSVVCHVSLSGYCNLNNFLRSLLQKKRVFVKIFALTFLLLIFFCPACKFQVKTMA